MHPTKHKRAGYKTRLSFPQTTYKRYTFNQIWLVLCASDDYSTHSK